MIPSGVHLGSLQITRLVITRLIVWMLLLGSRGEGAFAPTPCRSRPFPPTPQRICCWRVKENQPIRWPDLKRRYLGGVTGSHRATWGSSPRGSRHSTRVTSLRRSVQPGARCQHGVRARWPPVTPPGQPVSAGEFNHEPDADMRLEPESPASSHPCNQSTQRILSSGPMCDVKRGNRATEQREADGGRSAARRLSTPPTRCEALV